MNPLLHVAMGMTIGFVIVLFLDWPPKKEITLMVASGVWGVLPDFWLVFYGVGYESIAVAWRSVHESALSNIFWFHHLLDRHETGYSVLEAGIALLILGSVALVYYHYTEWNVG